MKEMQSRREEEGLINISNSSSDIPEALSRGIHDCQQGKKRSQNPYAQGSPEAKLWLQGWMEIDSFHDLIIQKVEPRGSC